MRLAIDRINEEGGVNVGGKTYTLALKVYDTAYDPTTAVTRMKEALDKDKIQYLEVLGGGIIPAVQPLTEKAGAVLFGAGAGNEFMGPDWPKTFRPYYDIVQSAEALLTEFKAQLNKDNPNVVFVEPDDDLGHEVGPDSEAAAKKLGYTTKVLYLARDASDFAPLLTNLLKDEPDVVDLSVTPQTQMAPIVKQARQMGYTGYFSFPDTAPVDLIAEAAGKDALVGSLTSPYWGSLETEQGDYWLQNVESIKGGDAEAVWTVQVYDNLFLLKAAFEKADSLDPNDVAEALLEVSIDGALGRVSYDADRKFDIPYPIGVITDQATIEVLGS